MPPPIVTTTAASALSSTSATLNGTVNPQGSTAAAKFQYSTSSLFTPTVQTTLALGFSEPLGLAVDAAGDVFVADFDNNAVKEVLPNGTILTIGSGFSNPHGVAVDASGDVFVADFSNNAAKEVLASGTSLTLGSDFNYPTGVAVDAVGDVYVADLNNNRVVGLSPPATPAAQSPVSGSSARAVSATLTGLTSGTTYYYRAVASGTAGTVAGATGWFTTTAAPTVVSVTPEDNAGNGVAAGSARSPAAHEECSGGPTALPSS